VLVLVVAPTKNDGVSAVLPIHRCFVCLYSFHSHPYCLLTLGAPPLPCLAPESRRLLLGKTQHDSSGSLSLL